MITRIEKGELPSCGKQVLRNPGFVLLGEDRSFCNNCIFEEIYKNDKTMINSLDFETEVFGFIVVSVNKEFSLDEEERSLFRGVAQDISYALHTLKLNEEQKKAEKELKISEKKFRVLVENIPLKFYIKDKNFRYLAVNENYLSDLNFKEEDVIGKTDYDLFPKEIADKYREDSERIMLTGRNEVCEEMYCIDDEIRWAHTTKTPFIDDNGEIAGIMGIFHDITKEKKSREIQNIVFKITKAVLHTESIEDLYKKIREELSPIIKTDNFYISMYDEIEETVTKPKSIGSWIEMKVVDFKDTLTGYVIKTGKPLLATREIMISMGLKDNILKFWEKARAWLGVPLVVDGRKIGAIVIYRVNNEKVFSLEDLNIFEYVSNQISIAIERKRIENNLKLALKRAEESDKLKTTFLHTMSHEIRTPLNAILGFSELIEPGLSPEKLILYSNTIKISGNNLLETLSGIIDLSLLKNNRKELNLKNFSLNNIIREAINIVRVEQTVESKSKIKISFIPQKEDIIINTDQEKILQILLNLLKNSLKFTHKGVIECNYELIKKNQEKFVKISVKDTGIGIKEKDQEIIFDIFRRGDESITSSYGGSGIGLAVAKELTLLMNGDMWLESKLNEGSTFYFTLPYNPEEKTIPKNIEKVKSLSKTMFADKAVLITEDEETNYFMLNVMLNTLNISTFWAKNGSETEKILNANPNIDMIMLDIRLPGDSGIEVCKKIKKSYPNLPIIAQTAYDKAEIKLETEKAGFDDFLLKPLRRNDVIKVLEKYLN